MKTWTLLIPLLLSACSTAERVEYSPKSISNKAYATKIIEQVIMQQPDKYRPESLFINDDYIGFNDGYSSKTIGIGSAAQSNTPIIASGISTTKTKSNNSRVYFNSLGPTTLWSKRSWYIIDIQNKTPSLIKRIYTRDQDNAKAFIDSIGYMKEHSTPIK